MAEVEKSNKGFVELSHRELITVSNISINSKQYFAAGSKAIKNNLALYDEVSHVAALLMNERKQAAQAEQRLVVIGLITAFLVLLYLFMALFSSLRNSITQISHNTAKLAEGDFQESPKLHSHDELAEIANSLNNFPKQRGSRIPAA